MAETLEQVKRRFGRDAVILNTRTLTKGGLLGMGRTPRIEITAARHAADLPESRESGILRTKSRRADGAEGAATPMASSTRFRERQPSDPLVSEVGVLKSLVVDLLRETRRTRAEEFPGELYGNYVELVQQAVTDEIARQLIEEVRRALSDGQLHDPKAVRAQLARAVESMLPTAGPIRPVQRGRPTIVALIGPTGVGKTTTVAKLAANLCLREHRKVGLITIDTYRIAAVDQLRTYAEIIDIPLQVVVTPNQLKDAVARLADKDVLLIDTAGRSQRDVTKIEELRAYFDVIRPDEVHLVLSSTCTADVLLDTIQRFQAVGIDRVIFTKLDEAIGFGAMLACLKKADAQLSYVTTGQDVPDDIEVGEGNSLAELVLNGSGHCRDRVIAERGIPTSEAVSTTLPTGDGSSVVGRLA
jgi:flagellar biosynthesis protein FlhF